MHDFLPSRLVLLAVLVATVVSAKDHEPQIRNVLLPWRPDRLARLIYVAGEVATVLHFEKDVDPARTKEDLGPLESPTRLYSRVWTGGLQVVIRYYAARPPGGDKVPICAVARLAKGQLKKLSGSKPGMAILEFSVAGVYVVDEFR